MRKWSIWQFLNEFTAYIGVWTLVLTSVAYVLVWACSFFSIVEACGGSNGAVFMVPINIMLYVWLCSLSAPSKKRELTNAALLWGAFIYFMCRL